MSRELDAIFTLIDADRPRMVERVMRWAAINTGTLHRAGLDRLAEDLVESCAPLGGALERIELPPYERVDERGEVSAAPLGTAIEAVKRPEAARRLFLGIHYDTVYGPEHPFQAVREVESGVLRGPGVADAKGGLAVMLCALEALEAHGVLDDIGWRVLINPDEELGSPGSAGLLARAAQACEVGLVFEPSLPDGSLIGARKGSGNYALIVRGRSAHAGREFFKGRNAVHLAAEVVGELARMSDRRRGVTVNVGRIDGGGPVNVVPDVAVVRFNVRVESPADQVAIEERLGALAGRLHQREGFHVTIHGGFSAPPKPLDGPTARLLETIRDCGRDLGLDLHWQPSGGVCDGNRLAAAGLTVVDTLGPRGGDIHSANEYLVVESLAERAKLTAALLFKLAQGQVDWPGDGSAGHGERAVSSLFE